jgi:hypothetical protein
MEKKGIRFVEPSGRINTQSPLDLIAAYYDIDPNDLKKFL